MSEICNKSGVNNRLETESPNTQWAIIARYRKLRDPLVQNIKDLCI